MFNKRFRGRYLVVGRAGVYHVVSRTAYGRFSFGDADKEMFIRILRKQAGFCGVEVLSFCILSNHFHLLVKVPAPSPISDVELLRRYRLLYNDTRSPASSPSPKVLEALLRENGYEAEAWRSRLLARMHDLAAFIRELKQRFGIWFNHRYENRGTLWSERFRSTLVEASAEALSTVAAYIDLNPVRAQLVVDPIDYRFSSYGRAVGGCRRARAGYLAVFGGLRGWTETLKSYNLILYGKGERSKGLLDKDTGRISSEKVDAVLRGGGRLPLSVALRTRVRYFTYGIALGSKAFLEAIAEQWASCRGRAPVSTSHPMREADWGMLRSYRRLGRGVIGRGSA